MVDRRFNVDNKTVVNYSAQTEPDVECERSGVDDLNECVHMEACLRVLGMLCFGGEIRRDGPSWEEDCSRILACSICDEWSDE